MIYVLQTKKYQIILVPTLKKRKKVLVIFQSLINLTPKYIVETRETSFMCFIFVQ